MSRARLKTSNLVFDFNVPISDAVRLVGGHSPREGRIEYIWNGRWVTLCNHERESTWAYVVCKQLGYSDGAEEIVTDNR